MLEILPRWLARREGHVFYFTGQPCRNGHLDKRYVSYNRCKTCHEINVAKQKLRPEFKAKHSARDKAWKLRNPEGRKQAVTNWELKNPDHKRIRTKEWERRNPERVKAKKKRMGSAQKRARRQRPPWVDRSMLRAIYAACPPGHSVDHIIPLKGKTVSGLHVPWNLQYLTQSENSTKGIRWSEEMAFSEVKLTTLQPRMRKTGLSLRADSI